MPPTWVIIMGLIVAVWIKGCGAERVIEIIIRNGNKTNEE